MSAAAGTTCRLYYDCGPRAMPHEGDFIRTPTGTCYQVLEARRSPSRPNRVNLKVMRLEKGAVEFGEPGVWPLYWHPRGRAAS